MSENKEQNGSKLISGIINHGITGSVPGMDSATTLANTYLKDATYKNNKQRVSALIRWETSKSAGTGFLTGLGGVITLPVAVPAALYASWVVQARLAATIAIINGYSIKDDRVQTFILLSLIGDAGKEILKDAGIQVGKKVSMNLLKKIPGKLFIEINKKVGFRLITKAGEKGIINMTKLIPLVGGVAGALFDGSATNAAGKAARAIFTEMPPKKKTKNK